MPELPLEECLFFFCEVPLVVDEPFGGIEALSYILSANNAEGSHNGSAAVLKTAGRKAMQVRVLSPPPFLTVSREEVSTTSR